MPNPRDLSTKGQAKEWAYTIQETIKLGSPEWQALFLKELCEALSTLRDTIMTNACESSKFPQEELESRDPSQPK